MNADQRQRLAANERENARIGSKNPDIAMIGNEHKKRRRSRSAFKISSVFLRVSVPPWWVLRFPDPVHKRLQLARP